MGWRLTIQLSLCLLYCSSISAQRVYYCEPYSDRFTLREELLGKVGEYYWVATTTRKRVPRRSAEYAAEERNFTIYNTRMNLINQIGEASYTGDPIKEYIITTYDHFDQVHLLKTDKKQVEVWLHRYEPDGLAPMSGRVFGTFPFD